MEIISKPINRFIGGLGIGNNVTVHTKRITLTSANILALHSSPLSLVPAPAAGRGLLFNWTTLQFTAGGIAFTGGGAVSPVYHGATTDLSGTGGVASGVITGAVNDVKFVPAISIVDVTAATGIDLYAATANFAAGNGSAIVEICYSVVRFG